MKKVIIVLLGFLMFTACDNAVKTQETVKSSVVVETPVRSLEFSDPARIGGSNFGDFFISMIRTQNYEMALSFTSKQSIEKFGKDEILNKYKNFKFNYKLTQKSISADLENPGNFVLAYTTNEYATGKIKKISVVVENDSCKLVLPDNIDDLLK